MADNPTHREDSAPLSRHLPGPPFLREYPHYELVAWQPRDTLDDAMLDQIADWLVIFEKSLRPFKRFIDLNRLDAVAITTHHLFEFARRRAKQFPRTSSVRTALFCAEWVGFGIARMYEALMAHTRVEVRAFQDLARAANWLSVPTDVLQLKDEPIAYNGTPG